jgi:four helix bundle protein
MSRLAHAGSFTDLAVYQKAKWVSRKVFEVTKSFPREETFSLTDQVRRSARAIGAQIAEAWAKRRYQKHFISKLTDADAEQYETQHWIGEAVECGYLNPAQGTVIIDFLKEVGRMLNAMIEKADLFCGSPTYSVREAAAEYFVALHEDNANA